MKYKMVLYKFDRSYISKLSFRIEQKNIVLDDINSEKLYIRTKQYTSVELATSLGKAIFRIMAIMEKRISDAKDSNNSSIAR